MIDDTDRQHLERCVQLAADALNVGNEPFGSILVSADGAILLEAVNEVEGGNATVAAPTFLTQAIYEIPAKHRVRLPSATRSPTLAAEKSGSGAAGCEEV